ncbi:MAG: hypothetical protein F6K34_26295 [Okeania sp. SIO4D6]|nr:hypothetical protein [Okeania sp. SIO4D6]
MAIEDGLRPTTTPKFEKQLIVFVHTIFLFWLPLLIEPIYSLFYHPFDWPWQL